MANPTLNQAVTAFDKVFENQAQIQLLEDAAKNSDAVKEAFDELIDYFHDYHLLYSGQGSIPPSQSTLVMPLDADYALASILLSNRRRSLVPINKSDNGFPIPSTANIEVDDVGDGVLIKRKENSEEASARRAAAAVAKRYFDAMEPLIQAEQQSDDLDDESRDHYRVLADYAKAILPNDAEETNPVSVTLDLDAERKLIIAFFPTFRVVPLKV